MESNGRPAAAEAAPSRRGWANISPTLAVVVGLTVAGAVLVSAISYQHEYELARHNQQAPWVSGLMPFSVDGILFVAGIALLWAALSGVRGWGRLWQPRCVLAVGVLATIAANFFSDRHYWWLGPAVSASAGVSLVLMSAVAFWLPAEQRKLSRGDTGRRGSACTCPPPPVTLAEALPLARTRLRDEGQPAGEDKLADRFGVTRHQVRTALAEAVKDVPAGDLLHNPAPPAGTLSPNGDSLHG